MRGALSRNLDTATSSSGNAAAKPGRLPPGTMSRPRPSPHPDVAQYLPPLPGTQPGISKRPLAAAVSSTRSETTEYSAAGGVTAEPFAGSAQAWDPYGAVRGPGGAGAGDGADTSGEGPVRSTTDGDGGDTWFPKREVLAAAPAAQAARQAAAEAARQANAAAAGGRATPRKKVVFTITTGHAGTVYLSSTLQCSEGVVEHEAAPAVLEFYSILTDGLAATYNTRAAAKLPALDAALRASGDSPYVDVSHMFIKSQADVVMDALALRQQEVDVHVVVLRRNLPALIRSHLTDITAWTSAALNRFWGEYTTEHTAFSLLPPLPDMGDHVPDAVDRIVGYLADFELQLHRFRLRYPWATIHEVRAEYMFADGGAAIRAALGLPPPSYCILRPANPRTGVCMPELAAIPDTVFMARAQAVLTAYARAGIRLRLPGMDIVAPCQGAAMDALAVAAEAGGPGGPPPDMPVRLCTTLYHPMDAVTVRELSAVTIPHTVIKDVPDMLPNDC